MGENEREIEREREREREKIKRTTDTAGAPAAGLVAAGTELCAHTHRLPADFTICVLFFFFLGVGEPSVNTRS